MGNDENTYGRCHILSNWTDWDYSIHCDKAQIERQGRAFTYPFTITVHKKKKTATCSSTSDMPYYTTTLSSCNCHDFQERKLPCKHIYRLAAELGVIEIINRHGHRNYNKEREKLAHIKAFDDIHNEPDQLKRQKSAMSSKCTPTEIDHINQTGIFKGSGKNPYTTTLNSCTCRDYFVRRLPCKHMYRLAMELGLFEGDFKTNINDIPKSQPTSNFTISDAIKVIDTLNFDEQSLLFNILYTMKYRNHSEYAAVYKNNPPLKKLLEIHMVEVSNDTTTLLNSYSRNELNKKIIQLDENIEFKKNMKLDNLIQWIMDTIPEKIPNICNDKLTVIICDDYYKLKHKMYLYLKDLPGIAPAIYTNFMDE